MQPTTPSTQFQLAVPYVLSSISPSLAALHATRARLLNPQQPFLSGTFCTKCGHSLITCGGQTRTLRSRRRKVGKDASPNRLIRRSCRRCGHDEDISLGVVAGAPPFPKPRDRAEHKPDPSNISSPRASSAAVAQTDVLIPTPAPSQPIPSSSLPAPSRPESAAFSSSTHQSASSRPRTSTSVQEPARSISRPKKKARLQDMLARNRERQEQEKKREGGQGLAAFLQGL